MRLRRESGGGGNGCDGGADGGGRGGGGGNCSPEELQERRARCIALEKAYVHDVYEQLAPRLATPRLWPRVHQFLRDLELGSLVADVGCGNGQYLEAAGLGALGCDRSSALARAAASCGGHQVVLGDALALPFRDEALDAALSVAVLHHLASTERRVQALRELARVLRVGGRVLITVWAMEQTQRKFESQDVLVPYRQPTKSSSEDRGSSVEREMTSTTTSEDDLLVYQSYNPPASDSDSAAPARSSRHRRGSVDGSDLSSPGETCYSFMRRALRKLSSTTANHRSRPYFYSSCRGGWFSDTNTAASVDSKVTSPQATEKEPQLEANAAAADAPDEEEDDGLIELRHLDAELPVEESARSRPHSSLEGEDRFFRGHGKSRSLGDVLSIIPAMLRARRRKEGSHEFQKRISTASDPREYLKRIVEERNGIVRSKSTASCCARFEHLREDYQLPPMVESQESPDEPEASEGQDSEEKPSSRAGDEDVTTNVSSQLTTSDIANGNSILSEEQLSTIVKEQLGYLQSPPTGFYGCRTKNWFNSFNNNANLEKCLISAASTATVHDYISAKVSRTGATQLARKRMRLYGQRFQEKSLLRNFYNQCSLGEVEEKRSKVDRAKDDVPMSTYYSMPDLHTLSEESTQLSKAPTEKAKVPLVEVGKQERSKDSFDSDIFVEDEEACRVLHNRRRVVKRSMSVGTNNGTEPRKQHRRFSASSASASMCASPTTPRSRNVSEDSEESVVSVRSRKCSSLQSDTSVDSEESIVSVIQRSSSEIEAIMQRRELQRAASNSLRASPLSITPGAQEASSPEFSPTFKSAPKNSPPLLGSFPRQYLEKFSDCEAVVIRDVIGAIVSFAQCTDTIYIQQWENLEDSPQQPEAKDPIGEIASGDNDSDSGDTESYMSNPDCTAAGGDASCCEDDIPQIEFDVVDMDDPYCTAPDTLHEDDSLATTSESQRTQTFVTCPSTEDSSSPRCLESGTSSSEGTLEPETEVPSSENEPEGLSASYEQNVAGCLSPDFWAESTGGPSPTLSDISTIDDKVDLDADLFKSKCNIENERGLISFVSPTEESTQVDINVEEDAIYKKNTEAQAEEKDVDCSETAIKLTVVKKMSPYTRDVCEGMSHVRSGEKYWEHLLPSVLSMDSEDTPVLTDVKSSQQCVISEVSSDDSINGTVAMRKPTSQDSSPDDSLESIEECSEEEMPGESENADEPENERKTPLTTQPQADEVDKEQAGQVQPEITACEENKDDCDATGAEVNDKAEDIEDDGDSSDCPPPAFNFVVEDYSEESDSCNEQAVEENTVPTCDSLTVERLVNSTSNGSSSTASFQTVLQCPSPTTIPVEEDDVEKCAGPIGESEASEMTANHKRHDELPEEARGGLSRKESASLSSSQESLQDTDGGGSSLMLHRYYHVFREGELDSLIDKYVENLHIISSYYDRASWCVIAEKVQVWTI
ncbi:class I SAM-dependent methyltransferase fire dancer [Amblyomma americanum]